VANVPGWRAHDPGWIGPAAGTSAQDNDDEVAVRITVSIEQAQPVSGTAWRRRGAPLDFVGWLGLLRVLERLVAESQELCPASSKPGSAQAGEIEHARPRWRRRRGRSCG
jgi:hypothetical protein